MRLDLKEKVDCLKELCDKNSPTILSGLAVVGLWTTAYLAYRAAPKVKRIMKHKRREFEHTIDSGTKLAVAGETVKELAPVVAPTLLVGAASTASIIFSNRISTKRLATMTAAYTLVDTSYREFRNKLEDIDKAKAQRARELVAKDHIEGRAVPDDEFIESTGFGNVLCYDEYTDKYFYSCAEAIGEAILKISYRLQSEMWVSLNDLRYELGLKPCKMGEDLGWSVDHVDQGRIPVYYTAILTDNKVP